MAVPQACNLEKLLRTIEESQSGYDTTLQGPFSTRRVVYADYTASGKPLQFIEDYLRQVVLPYYGNTHTTTSLTSRQTTFFREEARLVVRNAVNASEEDAVVFVGSGCTAAVHKLIHCLGLSDKPHPPPVVFVSPFEHHSNLLPWRDIGAEVVWLAEDPEGNVDITDLEQKLIHYSKSGRQLIGSLNAASNITGVLTDTLSFSALLHKYGALSFWDYASAAPYVKMDMNPVVVSSDRDLVYKDAIFFSVHKFVGGPETPGVLVAKKKLFRNPIPDQGGGGTVFFVTPGDHRYLKEVELREEGGTPAIIGSIRAGLVMQLKETVGCKEIMAREKQLVEKVLSKWKDIPQLVVIGPHSIPRLPIFSFLVRHEDSGHYLHHNFVCSVLNDVFGIQARGGCSCAGPYAQRLLGISEALAGRYEAQVMEDSRLDRGHLRRYHEYSEREVLRPGVTRLSFTYFMSEEAVDYIISAVSMTARHGWKLLPQYLFNPETGLFRHRGDHPSRQRQWLSSVSYQSGVMTFPCNPSPILPPSYKESLEAAERLLQQAPSYRVEPGSLGDHSLFLEPEVEQLRWFLLPSEAARYLTGLAQTTSKPSPFQPQRYGDGELEHRNDMEGRWQNGMETEQLCNGLEAKSCISKENSPQSVPEVSSRLEWKPKFHHPPKNILRPTIEAMEEYHMLRDGDRVLVCLSGGKDSLSLLHTLWQYRFLSKAKGVNFTIGAVTVDPGSASYNPRPLIPYLAALGVPYFYEEQGILQKALLLGEDCVSICSFCSRMKRGRLYSCARREGYNVLALGQHLDDLAESFLMSAFHNGLLRTMKASYTVEEGDLRVIRPLAYVREVHLRAFADSAHLPVIAENCPACFEAPKERHRVKQLLASQEVLYPRLFPSLQAAMRPLMARDKTGMEARDKPGMEARDKTGMEARDKTGMEARDTTGMEARDKTGMEAKPSTGKQQARNTQL